ncbi:hypothetical protein ASB65_25680 [Agrobacterium tumefaciens str. B6]|jgi:hypothetical protein|nr:hypothetical protein ASB65_25680 [Agrobacterium tumefaciens str. B6]MQB28282.1 hypothetical protein [Agrobacterium tumefaciens]OCJ37295.1 hypothetical protein A6U90_24170 [Agrobacterium tumefaciens]
MLVDAGSRFAKGAARLALPFRLRENDAAEMADGDGRERIFWKLLKSEERWRKAFPALGG